MSATFKKEFDMKPTLLTLFISLFLSCGAFAKSKLTNVDFKREGQVGRIIIQLADEIARTPEIEVRDGFIQISMPDTFVWPKLEKKISINKNLDTLLTAYQFDNDNVRFRAYVPNAAKFNVNNVNLKIKDKAVWLEFPVDVKEVAKAAPTVNRAPALDPSSKTAKPEQYDESYLNKLLADKENLNVEVEKGKIVATEAMNKTQTAQKDEVNVRQAAQDKKESFSLAGYAAKFVAFLALFIVVMYGAVHFLKKGVLGKSKLGFLNSTKTIEVLSTTYLGPKRSLLLVRAHKQVFLVGSSESGLQYISEVNDLPGVIKEGEKAVAGDNFDTNFGQAETTGKEFNLKSVIDMPAVEEVKESVKLSDQIKSKVKSLKPLQ